MKKMVKNNIQVDSIITDPPYDISRKTGFSNSKLQKYKGYENEFGEWDKEFDIEEFIQLSFKILKDGGTLFMFFDIWKIQTVKEIAEKNNFKQSRFGLWIKTNPVPINSKLNYLTNSKEAFITFTKKSKPTFNSSYDKGIYTYPICHGKERTKHTTQKPLKLMEEIVIKHSNEGDLIFDPFMGSGTTGEACLKNNRKFLGIEKNEEYFKICENRLIKENND